jgi:hypothetical protein
MLTPQHDRDSVLEPPYAHNLAVYRATLRDAIYLLEISTFFLVPGIKGCEVSSRERPRGAY